MRIPKQKILARDWFWHVASTNTQRERCLELTMMHDGERFPGAAVLDVRCRVTLVALIDALPGRVRTLHVREPQRACAHAQEISSMRTREGNKKQCSRQLQCEVPCGVGNVINSSLFINSSLSSLSSTSHAICREGVWLWGGPQGEGGSTGGRGPGDISVQLPYTARPHGASP